MEKKIIEQYSPNASIDKTAAYLRAHRNKALMEAQAPIDYIAEVNVKWPYTTLTYCPLSDLHAGNINARMDAFDKWVSYVETTYNAVTILNGDILDNPTQLSISNTHDEILPPEEVIDYLYEKLLPIAKQNKIIAITPGNHDSKSGKRGVDTNVSVLKSLAERLNVPFVEHNIVVNFEMPIENSKDKHTFKIATMHGAGKAGGVAGALDTIVQQMNRVFGSSNGGIDILDAGHFHQGGNLYYRCEFPEKDRFNRTLHSTSKEVLFVSNYSFQDNSDYAAEANFGAANVNSWGILVKPEHNVYYKTNEHENNKYVTKFNVYKIFNKNLDISLPAKVVNNKYYEQPQAELYAKVERENQSLSASQILKQAEKQGGMTKWVKLQIHTHLKKRKSL